MKLHKLKQKNKQINNKIASINGKNFNHSIHKVYQPINTIPSYQIKIFIRTFKYFKRTNRNQRQTINREYCSV